MGPARAHLKRPSATRRSTPPFSATSTQTTMATSSPRTPSEQLMGTPSYSERATSPMWTSTFLPQPKSWCPNRPSMSRSPERLPIPASPPATSWCTRPTSRATGTSTRALPSLLQAPFQSSLLPEQETSWFGLCSMKTGTEFSTSGPTPSIRSAHWTAATV